MCRAYTLTRSSDQVMAAFDLEGGAEFTPSYNLRPTDLAPVILPGNEPGLSSFYWGSTPAFARNKTLAEKLFNTRAEAVAQSPMQQKMLRRQRCLVPADGFYAWRQISKKGLVPYYYFLDNRSLFSFAGIWQEFEQIDGKVTHTFSIITCRANAIVAQSEPRMPVIFDITKGLHWLHADEKEALLMLHPYPDEKITTFAVAPRVNNPENNGPELIAPAPPADQFGNYTLFD